MVSTWSMTRCGFVFARGSSIGGDARTAVLVARVMTSGASGSGVVSTSGERRSLSSRWCLGSAATSTVSWSPGCPGLVTALGTRSRSNSSRRGARSRCQRRLPVGCCGARGEPSAPSLLAPPLTSTTTSCWRASVGSGSTRSPIAATTAICW